MQILIPTSDKTMYALRAFAWLWQRYANTLAEHPIHVVGYTPLPFELPSNYSFASIGRFEDYPAQRWSDGLMQALASSNDPIVLLLFDDYWMQREVDTRAIMLFERYMYKHDEVLRFDLSGDRTFASGIQPFGSLLHYDLLLSDASIPYNFSLQAALWRREKLKQLLVSNESAWELEWRGTERLKDRPDFQVLGTQQIPMKYLIAVQQGKLALDGGYQYPRLRVNQDDIEMLRQLNFLSNL